MWTGARGTHGYGNFSLIANKKWVRAHRFSYEIYVGKIPKGKVVMHLCDVPFCVNPKHLKIGTQLENLQDMTNKGRRKNQYA